MLTLGARCLFGDIDGRLYAAVTPEAMYSPWRVDTAFQEVHAAVSPHTLVDVYRCYELWELVAQTLPLGGDILEVGVWNGGSGCLIAARARACGSNAKVYLCDTFTGVVKAGIHDNAYKGGEFPAPMSAVNSLAAKLGLSNVVTLKGIFPEETGHLIESNRFVFCHVDVDVYQSARDTVEWIWPRLAVGGVIAFDDYGSAKTRGVMTCVNEFTGTPGMLKVHNLNGHALLIKTSEREA